MSARAVRHAWLTGLITEIHQQSRANYGARRVHAELRLGRGMVVGHGAVEMLHSPCRTGGRHGPAEMAASQTR
ncbi:IS3 family transposase [Micromonospora sp. NPDC005237]|uniref:IS3 family transposase n=1 Tax=Micromonospora sp. NPDC005237 TaxID=3155113 RepID=UPI0033B9F038